MNCRICGETKEEGRNIDLYVVGSEGLWACWDCEMMIVAYVRQLISLAGKCRMAGYKACKELRDAK